MPEEAVPSTPRGSTQPWHRYRCVACHRGSLEGKSVVDGVGEAICGICSTSYRVRHNIVDTLLVPSPAVIQELRGLAVERDMDPEQWAEVKLRQVDHVTTLEERLAGTVDEPVQYYQQTTASFDQALRMVEVAEGATVLEVGVHAPFYFLERFRQRGAECFALNILFFHEEPDRFWDWPHQALGDMNDLPYQDGTIDVVLLSATAHHSSDIRRLFGEVARVLVPGGRALVVNEPVEGLVKSLGRRRGNHHHRDEHIHEGAYRIWDYTSALRAAGLEGRCYFPDFFDRKLASGDLHAGTRFRPVAALASRIWGLGPVRGVAKSSLLWPAQAILGFPFNAVLIKSSGSRSLRGAPRLTP